MKHENTQETNKSELKLKTARNTIPVPQFRVDVLPPAGRAVDGAARAGVPRGAGAASGGRPEKLTAAERRPAGGSTEVSPSLRSVQSSSGYQASSASSPGSSSCSLCPPSAAAPRDESFLYRAAPEFSLSLCVGLLPGWSSSKSSSVTDSSSRSAPVFRPVSSSSDISCSSTAHSSTISSS